MPWLLENGQMMTVNLHNFGNKTLSEMADYLDDVRRRIGNTNMELAMLDVSLQETRALAGKGLFIKVLRRCYGAFCGKNRLRKFSRTEKRIHRNTPDQDRITIKDLEQGSITVSNIGASAKGVSGAMTLLEIIPPQVFAIGISPIQRKPLAVQDESGQECVAVRSVLPFCLSFDHRALDFSEVAPFIQRLDEIFKNPETILGW
jgi:pyruvate dehydrogenase E2 component (dihydrolipoamide acetyltransferase)